MHFSRNAFVSGELLDIILDKCPNLNTVELHQVDLSRVSEQTALRIAALQNAHQLAVVECGPPTNNLINDFWFRQFHFNGILQVLQITDNPNITDNTLKFLAYHCPLLWYCVFSGCRGVRALGVYYFLRLLAKREQDLLYLKVDRTDVNGMELEQLLYSQPQTPPTPSQVSNHQQEQIIGGNLSHNVWHITTTHLEIGRRACCIQNSGIVGKTVVVFI